MSAIGKKRALRIPTAEDAARLLPFPLWEIQHPEEPAYGLLARTVERSLPGTLAARLSDLGAYGGHSVTKANLAEIARICEADPVTLGHSTPKVGFQHATLLGQNLRRDDFSVARRRWCPMCLSEHGCHLVWFDLPIVTSCPRHGVTLVERCECGKEIRWKNQKLFSRCNCGVALKDVPASPLEPGTGIADRYVVGRLTGSDPVDVPFLDGLPLVDAIEVLRNVGHLSIMPDAGRRPLEREVGFRRLFDEGYLGVESFPESFRALLDRTLARASVPKGKFGATRVYGTTFSTWLTKREPASLDRAISAEVCLHAGRNLTLNKRKLMGVSLTRDRVSLVEAAVICGVAFDRMKRILIQRGMLPEGQGSRSESFERLAVERIARTLRHGIPMKEVARELGVSRNFLRSMVRLGVIAPIVEKADSASWLFPADSANSLMERLRAAVKPSAVGRVGLPIPLAAKSLGLSMGKLAAEVLEGTIQAIGQLDGETGVGSILVDVQGLRPIRRRASTETMTARDVAKAYAVKEEVAIALLRQGVIAARHEGYFWMADKASVDGFFERHALLGPYAAKLRTSRKYLARSLEAAGIRPALGPPVVGQKLFLRDDVDGYLAREGWPPKDWQGRRRHS